MLTAGLLEGTCAWHLRFTSKSGTSRRDEAIERPLLVKPLEPWNKRANSVNATGRAPLDILETSIARGDFSLSLSF